MSSSILKNQPSRINDASGPYAKTSSHERRRGAPCSRNIIKGCFHDHRVIHLRILQGKGNIGECLFPLRHSGKLHLSHWLTGVARFESRRDRRVRARTSSEMGTRTSLRTLRALRTPRRVRRSSMVNTGRVPVLLWRLLAHSHFALVFAGHVRGSVPASCWQCYRMNVSNLACSRPSFDLPFHARDDTVARSGE